MSIPFGSTVSFADCFSSILSKKIVYLKQQLEMLEKEKLFGKREIDDIEKDCREVQGQIKELQRKHINFFYYF